MSDGSRINWRSLLRDSSFMNMDNLNKLETLRAKMREQPQFFFRCYGLAPYQFDALFELIRPHLMMGPRRAAFYLSMTLRYFSSGGRKKVYTKFGRMCQSSGGHIITSVSTAISKALLPLVSNEPTEEYFIKTADSFRNLWNFPNCVGAIDGRLILCRTPGNDGKQFEITIFTICDAHFKFTDFQLSIFTRKEAERKLVDSRFSSEVEKAIVKYDPKENGGLPFVFLADWILSARNHIIQPFKTNFGVKKMIFNYRHDRAMNAADSAFGILLKRWEIFQLPLIGTKYQATLTIKCLLRLHNWLINQEKELPPTEKFYMPRDLLHDKDEHGFLKEGSWGSYSTTAGVKDFESDSYYAFMTEVGKKLRQECAEYFEKEGSIPSQWAEVQALAGVQITAGAETEKLAEKCVPIADTPQPNATVQQAADAVPSGKSSDVTSGKSANVAGSEFSLKSPGGDLGHPHNRQSMEQISDEPKPAKRYRLFHNYT